MRAKGSYEESKSAFLGMDKDISRMMEKILENKKLLKLLYYSTPDSLSKSDLDSEQIKSLITNNQITNVPEIKINSEGEGRSYLVITFDDFKPNDTNKFYRDHVIRFQIMCPYDYWKLDNFQLRPYRIAAEIDSMFAEKRFSGIGVLNFIRADLDIYDNGNGGIVLNYYAVRGNEDKINPLVTQQ